jgi:hypothetical protein
MTSIGASKQNEIVAVRIISKFLISASERWMHSSGDAPTVLFVHRSGKPFVARILTTRKPRRLGVVTWTSRRRNACIECRYFEYPD